MESVKGFEKLWFLYLKDASSWCEEREWAEGLTGIAHVLSAGTL